MKKTLSINLNNTVFHIDEEAYEALQHYFDELKSYFANEADGQEILRDVEARIGELFADRIKYGLQVITLPNVEEIIQQMGQPSEFGKIEEEAEEPTQPEEETAPEEEQPTRVRRLYRDKERALLGGVASGLAHYTNIDVVFIRLLMIVFLFIWGAMIPIYLIFWIITPAAESSAQKLEMHGIDPTIENISNFIKEGAEKIKEGAEYIGNEAQQAAQSPYTKSVINKTRSGVTAFFSGVLRLLFALIGGCFGCFGLMIIFPILVLLIALLSAPVELYTQLFPYTISNVLSQMSAAPFLIISALVVVGLPVLVLCYVVVQKAFKLLPIGRALGWGLFIVWILGLIGSIAWGVKTLPLLL